MTKLTINESNNNQHRIELVQDDVIRSLTADTLRILDKATEYDRHCLIEQFYIIHNLNKQGGGFASAISAKDFFDKDKDL